MKIPYAPWPEIKNISIADYKKIRCVQRNLEFFAKEAFRVGLLSEEIEFFDEFPEDAGATFVDWIDPNYKWGFRAVAYTSGGVPYIALVRIKDGLMYDMRGKPIERLLRRTADHEGHYVQAREIFAREVPFEEADKDVIEIIAAATPRGPLVSVTASRTKETAFSEVGSLDW